nr:PREDICTED: gustatory receptor for sugar taste 64e-like [Tribolium castaneum]|eukprot:XP_015835640.1 PREDICTED: gustatory receptor for sugar taste 64e-like [Tribolium castaneum]
MKAPQSGLLLIQPQNNFHKSLRFLFVIAQVFGYFPVQGVSEEKVTGISFTWFSLRVLSSLLTAFLGIVVIFAQIRFMKLITGYEQAQMNAIVFYGSGTLSSFLFIKLARDWHEIMTKWNQLDKALISHGWPKGLDKTLKRIAIIFLALEAAEHFTIQANKLIVAVRCRGSFSKGFRYFAVDMSFAVVFDFVDYAHWLGMIFQLMNTRMAFAWTFLDLFIILVSCALSERFRQINDRIQHLTDIKSKHFKEWIAINEDYNRLCLFCDYLDDKISWLILISFFNNFYFIIFQVHLSLNLVLAPPLEIIYYLISSSLLILRMVSVCIYANRVHEESKSPMDILSVAPLEIYNQENIRLIVTAKYQTTGLTARKMFLLTKNLIFAIAGAVLAYELIVIQLNKNQPRKQGPSIYSLC